MHKVIYLILVFLSVVVLANPANADETYQSTRMWPVLDQPWYFTDPASIAVDSYGNVYVADTGNNRIQKFTSNGKFIAKWGSYGRGDGQFQSPWGIAVDSYGNVYVVDTDNYRIQKFTTDGSFVTKWGSQGTGDGQFESSYGIAVDQSGNIYVADTFNNRIQKFTPDGKFITKWGSRGSGNGQFNNPWGIAIDSSGNIYVVDSTNYRIQKFTPDGSFVTKWGSNGSGDGQFENYPANITVDSSGNVYVADTYNHRIQKFTSDGKFIIKWGSSGTSDGQFEYPYGIAFDLSGNIYVADTLNERIQKFTMNGEFIAKWGSGGSGDGQLDYPRGITIDLSGNVYVADQINHRIQKFTIDGGYITKWGSQGSGDGQFDFIRDLAVDLSGNVYAVDSKNNRIQKFTTDGIFITKWGSQGSGDGQFNNPVGIAIDLSGNVYIADTFNNRIQKFDSNGRFIAKWGSQGSGDGQFDNPYGIAVDSSGNIYVADDMNYRIQKFAPDGSFVTKWGSLGSRDDQFEDPIGIAVDLSGNVYVSDIQSNTIKKFTPNGNFLAKMGAFGSDPGQLNTPSSLFVSKTGEIYVSDTFNSRIQVFTKTTGSNPSTTDKAIIVAGSGPKVMPSIWTETTLNTERADFALKNQGFSKSTIYYLSYSFGEFDIDGVDNIDALSTNANLKQAITGWAAGARNVIIYLIGHGDVGKFQMSDTEVLAASDLSSWLDTLQSTISGTMVVIYESCYSGSFLSQLKPHAGTPAGRRILITSATTDEQAYFTAGGTVSFSNPFWSDVLYGQNIYDSFVNGKDTVSIASLKQDPQIDANGNGIPNEKDDIAIAQAFTIGNGTKNAGAIPTIKGNVTAALTGKTTGMINVSNIVTTGTIQEVDALIYSPSLQSDSAGNPITSAYVPKEVLKDVGGGNYQGTYDGFTENGVYYISVYAIDDRSKTSIPVTTSLTQSSVPTSDPVPEIKANGLTGSVNIKTTDKLSITVSLDPGGQSGTKADWWLYANTDMGNYYYDVVTGAFTWKSGKSVTYQGQLFNLPSTELLNISGLPIGSYMFNFKVDLTPNGVLDGQIYSGSVTVNVNQ
ncbi:MAG: SBBP repeat-containing protein [Nitrospirae bacterium]|nr:SBBP repeat-containing protein [Nitrospirota bacterium]